MIEKQMRDLFARANKIALSRLFTKIVSIESDNGEIIVKLSGEHPYVDQEFDAEIRFAEKDGLKGFVEALDLCVDLAIDESREWLFRYCESDMDDEACISAMHSALDAQKEAFEIVLSGQEAVEARKLAKQRLLPDAERLVCQAVLATAKKLEQGTASIRFDPEDMLHVSLEQLNREMQHLVGKELLRAAGYAEEDLDKVYEAQRSVVEYTLFDKSNFGGIRGYDMYTGKFSNELILVLTTLNARLNEEDIQGKLRGWYEP